MEERRGACSNGRQPPAPAHCAGPCHPRPPLLSPHPSPRCPPLPPAALASPLWQTPPCPPAWRPPSRPPAEPPPPSAPPPPLSDSPPEGETAPRVSQQRQARHASRRRPKQTPPCLHELLDDRLLLQLLYAFESRHRLLVVLGVIAAVPVALRVVRLPPRVLHLLVGSDVLARPLGTDLARTLQALRWEGPRASRSALNRATCAPPVDAPHAVQPTGPTSALLCVMLPQFSHAPFRNLVAWKVLRTRAAHTLSSRGPAPFQFFW